MLCLGFSEKSRVVGSLQRFAEFEEKKNIVKYGTQKQKACIIGHHDCVISILSVFNKSGLATDKEVSQLVQFMESAVERNH